VDVWGICAFETREIVDDPTGNVEGRLLAVSERSRTKQVAFALRVCLKVEFAIEL